MGTSTFAESPLSSLEVRNIVPGPLSNCRAVWCVSVVGRDARFGISWVQAYPVDELLDELYSGHARREPSRRRGAIKRDGRRPHEQRRGGEGRERD